MTPFEYFWNYNSEQSRREYLREWGIARNLHHLISRVPFKLLSESEVKIMSKAHRKAVNAV